ncbi:hypothetical protein NQ315_000673 [Exocentrus adspersus]|uniref:Uncharacterized protein n=1 Tax=Exocentrus adspersus TaxID=1586481 RepID=A0AAV8VMY8_9CUCU|nr:hypothetical protein NQ315_000673 [Exocentrus adspersus]
MLELFKIVKVKPREPPTYFLEDIDGAEIKRAFYADVPIFQNRELLQTCSAEAKSLVASTLPLPFYTAVKSM